MAMGFQEWMELAKKDVRDKKRLAQCRREIRKLHPDNSVYIMSGKRDIMVEVSAFVTRKNADKLGSAICELLHDVWAEAHRGKKAKL